MPFLRHVIACVVLVLLAQPALAQITVLDTAQDEAVPPLPQARPEEGVKRQHPPPVARGR